MYYVFRKNLRFLVECQKVKLLVDTVSPEPNFCYSASYPHNEETIAKRSIVWNT